MDRIDLPVEVPTLLCNWLLEVGRPIGDLDGCDRVRTVHGAVGAYSPGLAG